MTSSILCLPKGRAEGGGEWVLAASYCARDKSACYMGGKEKNSIDSVS